MRETFGCGLRRFLFEPNTVTTRQLIKERIADAIGRWEPRVGAAKRRRPGLARRPAAGRDHHPIPLDRHPKRRASEPEPAIGGLSHAVATARPG
ncbi:MAG: GPW/gp25 family protein [Anaerolineae bacterium]